MSVAAYGLTGGIASGKTVVTYMFAELGANIIDADDIAKQIVEPNTPLWQSIIEHLGSRVLLPNGYLDRSWLREYIFQHPHERRWLEQLMHPVIRQSMQVKREQVSGIYLLMVIPLLIEHLDEYQDLAGVIVVDTDEQTQRDRLLRRDQNHAELIEQILAAQTSRKQRLAHADYVLHNDGDLMHLRDQVRCLDKYLRRVA